MYGSKHAKHGNMEFPQWGRRWGKVKIANYEIPYVRQAHINPTGL